MIHLIVEDGIVINRVNGGKPDGYPFEGHIWIAAEGDLEHVQIGWLQSGDGSFVSPYEPESEPE